MRKLIIAAALLGIAWVYFRFVVPMTLPNLEFPTEIIWKHTNVGFKGLEKQQFVEIVAIKNNKWRTEVSGRSRTLVEVFDGQKFATNYPGKNPRAPVDIEPTAGLRRILNAANHVKFAPVDSVGGSPCWRIRQDSEQMKSEIWIQCESRFFKKIVTKYADGTTNEDTYEIMPFRTFPNQVFDTQNLSPVLSRETSAAAK